MYRDSQSRAISQRTTEQLVQGLQLTHERQSQLKESSQKAIQQIQDKFKHFTSLLHQKEQQLVHEVVQVSKEKELVFETQRRIITAQLDKISHRPEYSKSKEFLRESRYDSEPLETSTINLAFNDNQLKDLVNSLAEVRSESPVCPGLCTLTGSLIGSSEIELGRTAAFNVVLKDRTGSTITSGNYVDKIHVNIRGPNGALNASVYDYEDGTYRVSFLCNTSAALYITVKVQGQLGKHHVQGSPFIINVVSPVSVYRSFNLISNPACVMSAFSVPEGIVSMRVNEDGNIVVGTASKMVYCYSQEGCVKYSWKVQGGNQQIQCVEQMPSGIVVVLFVMETQYYRQDGKLQATKHNEDDMTQMAMSRGKLCMMSPNAVWIDNHRYSLPVLSNSFAVLHGSETYYVSNFNYIEERNGNKLVRKLGGTGSKKGKLKDPSSIALSRDGHIIVADKGNHRIQIFSKSGNFVHQFFVNEFGQQEFNPDRVDVDHEGRIIVADFSAKRIFVI